MRMAMANFPVDGCGGNMEIEDEDYWEHVDRELYIKSKLKEILYREFSGDERLFKRVVLPEAGPGSRKIKTLTLQTSQ